jgi:hypothetical protein
MREDVLNSGSLGVIALTLLFELLLLFCLLLERRVRPETDHFASEPAEAAGDGDRYATLLRAVFFSLHPGHGHVHHLYPATHG